jgi:hypothetical protein
MVVKTRGLKNFYIHLHLFRNCKQSQASRQILTFFLINHTKGYIYYESMIKNLLILLSLLSIAACSTTNDYDPKQDLILLEESAHINRLKIIEAQGIEALDMALAQRLENASPPSLLEIPGSKDTAYVNSLMKIKVRSDALAFIKNHHYSLLRISFRKLEEEHERLTKGGIMIGTLKKDLQDEKNFISDQLADHLLNVIGKEKEFINRFRSNMRKN